jgi:hypothetical protein
MDEYNAPLSPTALVDKLIDELHVLAEYLDPNQQRIINRFCDVLLDNRTAVSDATNLLPLEAALFVIQVDEHQNTNYEISELHKRLDEVTRELQELNNRLNDNQT